MQLLTQNSDLRKTGIYGWTLPAHWVKLSNGKKFNTCPNAGVCAAFCYAKSGTFMFKNVRAAHIKKLEMVLYKPEAWIDAMNNELAKTKYDKKYIRLHDSGDFFSEEYALNWFKIMIANPQCTFYAYTKEVELFKYKLSDQIPDNFILIYSFGGKQDHMIDKDIDRNADVYTDYDRMISEGYFDIEDDDKLAAIGESKKVGIYRNNIPYLIKKQKNKNFSEWQKNPKQNKNLKDL